jgi:bifunctional DNase/RNase
MKDVVVESIRVNLKTQNRVVILVVILKEVDAERHLPIWIGDFEAQAIVMRLQGQESPRPLPYDLAAEAIRSLGGKVEEARINELREDVFYASIILAKDDKLIELDARPSDAVMFALQFGARMLIDDGVLDRAGVDLAETSETKTDEDIETDAES